MTTTPDFSHLQKLEVTEANERQFVFDELEGDPSIWVRCACEKNRAWLNERGRIAGERAEQMAKEDPAERRKRLELGDQFEEDREIDRQLISRTLAVRWGTPPQDAKGKKVEAFDPDVVHAFLTALPIRCVDRLRNYVQNEFNFVNRPSGPKDGGEALGNS